MKHKPPEFKDLYNVLCCIKDRTACNWTRGMAGHWIEKIETTPLDIQVVENPGIPPDQMMLRDPNTGLPVGLIKNIGKG